MTADSVELLVARYQSAARRHGAATTSIAAKKAADEIATTYRKLRTLGSNATDRLLPLLHDADPSVRCWAAAHALEFAPEQGMPVLQELAAGPGLVGLNATMTLSEWRAGRLRFHNSMPSGEKRSRQSHDWSRRFAEGANVVSAFWAGGTEP
jgi:hypothetical protein